MGAEDSIGVAKHDIWIYNLNDDPSNPDSIGAWNGEYLHDIEVYNNKIYGAAIYSGLFYIIDVSNKTNPTTLISYDTGGGYISTHDCSVTDDENYLITADETLGGHIKIWDISNYNNINFCLSQIFFSLLIIPMKYLCFFHYTLFQNQIFYYNRFLAIYI